jgi:hypothetical protein
VISVARNSGLSSIITKDVVTVQRKGNLAELVPVRIIAVVRTVGDMAIA